MHDTTVLTKIIREELIAAIKNRLQESAELSEARAPAGRNTLVPRYPRKWRTPVGKRVKTSTAYQKIGRLNKKTGKRTAVKQKAFDDGQPRYFSAGTIPNVKNRKIGTAGWKTKDKLGKQLLATWRRGDKCGQAMRKSIKKQLSKAGLGSKEPQVMSKIWAMASDAVAKGATDLSSFYSQYDGSNPTNPKFSWVKVCTGKKTKKSGSSKKKASAKKTTTAPAKKAAPAPKKKKASPRTAF